MGFQYEEGSVQQVDPGAASAVLALTAGKKAPYMRLTNNGTAGLFFLFGTSGTTVSATTGLPVPAGTSVVMAVPKEATHVAHIQQTAGAKLTVARGWED